MITVIVSLAMGYVVGSVPFAYILTKQSAHIDIRQSGSGNVGSFNAYVVTHSKMTGVLVGVLDCLKGLVVALAAIWLFPNSYLIQGVGLLGALAGHNYPVWIGFKGGRGLATAAGGMAVLGASYAIVWSITWLIAKKLKADILEANLIAILATPPLLWIIPWSITDILVAVRVESSTFLFFCCVLSAVLLLSHQDAVRDIWKGTKRRDTDPSSSTK